MGGSIGASCPLTEVGGHVQTIEQGSGCGRRRQHSEAFKAEAVAACRHPRISIAAAAMTRSIDGADLAKTTAVMCRVCGGKGAVVQAIELQRLFTMGGNAFPYNFGMEARSSPSTRTLGIDRQS